jgi:hypothetical protein
MTHNEEQAGKGHTALEGLSSLTWLTWPQMQGELVTSAGELNAEKNADHP